MAIGLNMAVVWFGLIMALRSFTVGHSASVNGRFLLSSGKRAWRAVESSDWTFLITGFGSNTALLTQLCVETGLWLQVFQVRY